MKLNFEGEQINLLDSGMFLQLKSYQDIILFGAGKSGDYFFDLLVKNNIPVRCYCDNYRKKQGTVRNQLPILAFQDAIEKYPSAAICVTSVFSEEIYNQIIEYDPKLKLQVFFVMNTMNWETNENLMESGESIWIANNYHALLETWNMLEDDKSKNTLEAILNFRITRDFEYIDKVVSKETTYFDNELFPKACRVKYKNYVDGGSFTGDTLFQYLKFMDEVGYHNITCFEPDATAAELLNSNIQKEKLKNINVRTTALWSDCGNTSFYNSGAGGGSIAHNNGTETLIKTECLDSLEMEAVDFVKLDVEGAEYDSLLGMGQTIQKFKPVLAVCVYHKQDDFIKIPNLIKTLDKNYKIYLRHYVHVPFETVLYAIPN